MKKTTELKKWLEKYYEEYNLPKPHITATKDGQGVYIHTGEKFFHTTREAKIFVNVKTFENINDLTQYLENVDDRIIHIKEAQNENN